MTTNLVIALVSAYCHCQACTGQWSRYGLTASGARPQQGLTIAAPRSLPFGTLVQVPGLGWRTVQDRAALRYDSRFDVYFRKHSDAQKWGLRKLTLTIVSK